jgi:hypothetical protein
MFQAKQIDLASGVQQWAGDITGRRDWAGIERAPSFEESDKADLGVSNPARAAAEGLKKMIREQRRPLQVRRYKVGNKWIVMVRARRLFPFNLFRCVQNLSNKKTCLHLSGIFCWTAFWTSSGRLIALRYFLRPNTRKNKR